MSLIGAPFLIWLLGFSINLLTLLARVISIGLVVDDAIVVVENAHRHVEDGEQPLEAALKGAQQVALPVLAATVRGVAPLLLAVGAGANSRYAIGMMIAAGMMIGTLFTLFVRPVFYLPFPPERRERGR